MAQTPRLIDGIVLTKFDTIDDKVRRPLRAPGGISFLSVTLYRAGVSTRL